MSFLLAFFGHSTIFHGNVYRLIGNKFRQSAWRDKLSYRKGSSYHQPFTRTKSHPKWFRNVSAHFVTNTRSSNLIWTLCQWDIHISIFAILTGTRVHHLMPILLQFAFTYSTVSEFNKKRKLNFCIFIPTLCLWWFQSISNRRSEV